VSAQPSPVQTHDLGERPDVAEGAVGTVPRTNDRRPLLLFFSNRRSGVARRMSSLVAWVSVTEKARLRVIEVDVDENYRFTKALQVETVPTLLLVRDGRVLARHEGRATGQDIEDIIRPHVSRDGSH
jgi:thioredoxin 1